MFPKHARHLIYFYIEFENFYLTPLISAKCQTHFANTAKCETMGMIVGMYCTSTKSRRPFQYPARHSIASSLVNFQGVTFGVVLLWNIGVQILQETKRRFGCFKYFIKKEVTDLTSDHQDLWRHMTSLGHSGLIRGSLVTHICVNDSDNHWFRWWLIIN